MERRSFLKAAFGAAAGAVVFAAGAQAAVLSPQPLGAKDQSPRGSEEPRPAVITGDEAARVTPEQVHWGHGHHWGWHHRHWGWRRHPHWHRRHWRRHRW